MVMAGHQVNRAWVTELYRDLGSYIRDQAERQRRDIRNFAALELEIAEQALQEDRLLEQGITPATKAPDVTVDQVLAEVTKEPTFEELEASLLDELLGKING